MYAILIWSVDHETLKRLVINLFPQISTTTAKLCLFNVHNGTKQKHGIAGFYEDSGMEDCEPVAETSSVFVLLLLFFAASWY